MRGLCTVTTTLDGEVARWARIKAWKLPVSLAPIGSKVFCTSAANS